MKFLRYFPKPFLDDILSSNCIPFIGAGFSMNADLPKGIKMPLWDELGRNFANLVPDYSFTNAIDAISAFEYEFSRPKMVEQLAKALHIGVAKSAKVHKAFCRLPFKIVCTTNFDFLLEDGYNSTSTYCKPIIEEDQLTLCSVDSDIVLLKLHGDLHHPKRLVITEEDYDCFIDRYPLIATFLSNLLISKTAFFIGYSLDDFDFRQIWQVIGDRLGKLRRLAYTINVNASSNLVARFERRGVKVINLPGKSNDYSLILTEVFNELREIWLKSVIKTSTITTEDTLTQLTLPDDAKSRICLFILPYDLLPFYQTSIFPIAIKHGFVPVTAEQLLTPGDNWLAKIQALIERSEVIVADLGSQNTLVELRIALPRIREKTFRLLPIIEKGTTPPMNISDIQFLVRPKNLYEESDVFQIEINKWFAKISPGMESILEVEPSRLLDKKEFRAAVISAITLLENRLRQLLENKMSTSFRPFPITLLLNQAIKLEVLDKSCEQDVKEWLKIRNKTVHSSLLITKATATFIVSGVYDLLKKIELDLSKRAGSFK